MNDNQNPPVAQSVSSDDQGLQQPVSVPVGSKESVSIPQPQEKWVQETAAEAKIEKELEEAGIEASKGEVLQVPQEVSQAGVSATGVAAPVPEEPALKFPMTEEKAEGILKMHKKIKDSIYWLAMLIVRQFKIIKFKQKENMKEEVAA